jgi:hypothetical protein
MLGNTHKGNNLVLQDHHLWRSYKVKISTKIRSWIRLEWGVMSRSWWTYCISQKAWTLCWKMIFTQAFTSHSYGVLGNLVDWRAKITMVIIIFKSSKYKNWLLEDKNKSMDVQHTWETQNLSFHRGRFERWPQNVTSYNSASPTGAWTTNSSDKARSPQLPVCGRVRPWLC